MRVIFASAKKISADKIKSLFLIICFTMPTLMWNFAWSADAVESQPQSNDIRVLIDVSGSMKKNDPKNLRLPALRLLVGLLPPDTSAAVWNFGTKAESIVAPGLANEKWKKSARQASKKIHSRDLFTNIGVALEAAVADWGGNPSKLNQRSIILLTDGMIDIGKDKTKNTQERTRILNDLLPKIQQTGANIHTIALSKNADHEFLQQLSTKTDGGFEQTDSAEQLERIFLRLFEKTTKPDSVPLVDNKFLVDESILELTLLVFKPQHARPTEVIEPDQTQYQKKNSPAYAKWQSEKNYDLITITRPKVGEWSINAQTDPDNRVLVVTNLQIQTNRIPNNLFSGETLNVGLFMSDNNNKITDDNFLQFISMSAKQKEPNKKRWFLHDNGLRGDTKAHDGLFNVQIKKTLELGKNQFTFQANTETFQREINYSVIIHDTKLINTRAEQIQKNNTNYHQILVTPNIEFVNPRTMKMSALLVEGDLVENEDSAQAITLQQINPNVLEWSYESDILDPDKDYHVIIHMLTKTRTGRPVDYTSHPIQLNLPQFDNLILTPNQLITDETASIKEDSVSIEKPVEEPVQAITETEAEEPDWLMGIMIAVIANIIFGVGGWFGYRKWKQGREAAYEELTGELE
ncbi:MAG: VWA domain-containing protein [gamma proteobacterium symbiont of Bathyaustriella thionipta]|nr:VWA domain-containing protein [gamma proteobacterium symbiont of Bathyaustriella thionipta]MCU7949886.1 VWA domain-containing protein [gamma proteobacterium symbiont of Bathyaustriella thionipta]MCU7953911.1 VWA domain-containing protein [gamma proteobacterium symbiont of Bathyaustriella thionipta]MCU7956483.1 VWA domain-containing protein [gamma proteobacterium symbiont of Bathyaustriella thionipta]MCU7965705.1 VWA domain-containing protein [gamma proteobacterium symbiont of Bathyaustriella